MREQNETTLSLRQLKRALGPIVHLDFTAFDSVTAHARLGMAVQPQVHSILTRKLDKLGQAEFIKTVRVARACRSAIIAKLNARHLDNIVKSAFGEYLDCLSGWARGARLDDLSREKFDHLSVDGLSITGQDLAFLLQNEDTGCQTGILRDSDGSIIMWHAEEDSEPVTEGRFDKLRLFSFRYQDTQRITAFIYPDLLPGPTFGWNSERFVQAIDTLYVKIHPHPDALMSNVVAWIRLCVGSETSGQDLIKAIRPFRTGCAITTIQQIGENWEGDRIEFAGDQWIASSLPSQPGKFLFQGNLFSERRSLIALTNEQVSPEKRVALEQRIARTHRVLRVIANSREKVKCLLRLLSFRVGGDYAYCNKDVKAHFVCQASKAGVSKWIGAGPAFAGEELWTF